jgi:PTS hybrid protein
MVSPMLLSHSQKVVDGARDIACEMAGGAAVIPVGGTKDGGLGTDFDRIFDEMQKAAAAGQVVVLADLGSARLCGESARDALPADVQENVHLSDAAIVEGALVAAVSIAAGCDAPAVLADIQEFVLPK